MPHSVFFTEAGHAIHGSHATARLGTPASHGCVRLAPTHAAILFDLLSAEGPGRVRIEITGEDPVGMGLSGGYGPGAGYRRVTSFDPLSVGIMVEGPEPRRRSGPRR